ncbi:MULTISPECIES: DUF6993 domain-containing protein [Arthrobacter]|uniref:DUF6993 domain-containing protein n=1 Tax=Arthrobacter TaxID=1663 RepID=UPI0017BA9F7F|nr:hypothetical protein [Arthrobacter psychrochitiniphilus]NYG17826.1 hypothetical protein [Arthrobacter psychrochitiniphilus]
MTLEKMTSRHQPTPRKLSLRAVGVSVLLVASMALSGCSLLPGEAPATDAAPAATSKAPVKDGANTPESKAPEEKQAEKVSAAEEMSGKLKATLTTLASTTKAPNREQMMAAMLEAGAVKEKVEVSIDITPTGLAVDAIESATLVGKECVIGQVRGGNVAVTTLPVLASGRCFVGDVH